jgi:hypothetical protein
MPLDEYKVVLYRNQTFGWIAEVPIPAPTRLPTDRGMSAPISRVALQHRCTSGFKI